MQEDNGARDHVEDLTTVTNSVTHPPTNYINNEYFITENQRVNKGRKNEDLDWIKLEEDIIGVIESSLKKMIPMAQQVGLKMIVGKEERLIQSFNVIRLKWEKIEASRRRVSSIS